MRKNKIVGPLPGAGRPKGEDKHMVTYKITTAAKQLLSPIKGKGDFISEAILAYSGNKSSSGCPLSPAKGKAKAMADVYGISMSRLHLETYIQGANITGDSGLELYWKSVLKEIDLL